MRWRRGIFFQRFIAFKLQIFTDSIGIWLNDEVHLGKKFLAAPLSRIFWVDRILQNGRFVTCSILLKF